MSAFANDFRKLTDGVAPGRSICICINKDKGSESFQLNWGEREFFFVETLFIVRARSRPEVSIQSPSPSMVVTLESFSVSTLAIQNDFSAAMSAHIDESSQLLR